MSIPELSSTIGMVIATRWEAGPVLRVWKLREDAEGFYRGTVQGREILLRISGVGMEKGRLAAEALCRKGVGCLISTGFCGALVPFLRIGDIMTDRIATSSRPVRTVEERRALAERAGAIAVDMETQAIIEAGTRLGVPIRVIRVISDETTDDLSPIFGSNGKFSPLAIAFRLLNPAVWPMANRLRKNSALAKQRMVEALQASLRDIPFPKGG